MYFVKKENKNRSLIKKAEVSALVPSTNPFTRVRQSVAESNPD